MMLRKSKTEILLNGKWIPLDKKWDYRKIGWLILILCSLVGGFWLYRWGGNLRNRIEAILSIAGEPENEANGRPKKIAGVVRINEVQYAVGRIGNLFRIEDRTIKLLPNGLISMNDKEEIYSADNIASGVILGINNLEQKPLLKFIRIEEIGKYIEEKVFYNRTLLKNARRNSRFLSYLTGENYLIIRDDDTAAYRELVLPVASKEIGDFGVFENYVYILTRRNSLIRKSLENTGDEKDSWERVRKDDENDKGAGAAAGEPNIVQAFATRAVILTGSGVLEEWDLTGKEGRLSETRETSELKKNKPSYLGAFKITNMPAIDNPAAWCLTSKEAAKCVNLNESFGIFEINAQKLLITKGNLYWVIWK